MQRVKVPGKARKQDDIRFGDRRQPISVSGEQNPADLNKRSLDGRTRAYQNGQQWLEVYR